MIPVKTYHPDSSVYVIIRSCSMFETVVHNPLNAAHTCIFLHIVDCMHISESVVANTSLITLETIFPEECAFIIGFSCTVWTKMKSLLAL